MNSNWLLKNVYSFICAKFWCKFHFFGIILLTVASHHQFKIFFNNYRFGISLCHCQKSAPDVRKGSFSLKRLFVPFYAISTFSMLTISPFLSQPLQCQESAPEVMDPFLIQNFLTILISWVLRYQCKFQLFRARSLCARSEKSFSFSNYLGVAFQHEFKLFQCFKNFCFTAKSLCHMLVRFHFYRTFCPF